MTDDQRQRLGPLWAFLRGFYGNKARDLGEQPNTAWVLTLATVDDRLLREGMRSLPLRYPSWPPTAGEFLALCRPDSEIEALDDGRLVSLANELGVKTIGRADRDGIVRDVRRAQARLSTSRELA